jgi:hypothetical protein
MLLQCCANARTNYLTDGSLPCAQIQCSTTRNSCNLPSPQLFALGGSPVESLTFNFCGMNFHSPSRKKTVQAVRSVEGGGGDKRYRCRASSQQHALEVRCVDSVGWWSNTHLKREERVPTTFCKVTGNHKISFGWSESVVLSGVHSFSLPSDRVSLC